MNPISGLFHSVFKRQRPALDHQLAVGGHWEDVGRGQFAFLVKEGLRIDHYLLDVACGSFRGGRFLIQYLMEGRYFGIDKDSSLIEAGIDRVLRPSHLLERNPQIHKVQLSVQPLNLRVILGARFDYIWVHALFDHISPEVIRRCLHDLTEVMVSGGRLYATIFLNPHGPDFLGSLTWPRNGSLDGAIVTYPDREYWHHSLEFFENVLSDIPELRLDACLDDYPHPLGLKVLRFVRL